MPQDHTQIHNIIISKLKNIEEQTTKTNGRVNTLEKELIETKAEIAKALTIISGHSTIIKYYKEEMDKAREELIEKQSREIEILKEEKEKFNKRVLYALIMAVLFLLMTLGYIREDVVKFIL